MACTWRSSPPAWPCAAGSRWATGTPYSPISRYRGPASPSPRTILSAPFQGMSSATSLALGQERRRAGGGLTILSRTWSGGHGHGAGVRGRRKCRGQSSPWTTRPLRESIPASLDHGLRGTHLRLGERARIMTGAKTRGSLRATWWQAPCSAPPPPPWTLLLPPVLWGPCVRWRIGPLGLLDSPCAYALATH